ncbi:hypothetical protein TNCV_3779021 [Trichonephila clavipes]|nr:hypothetical protein TNCV_3779021 [Trichonephila clavipes]
MVRDMAALSITAIRTIHLSSWKVVNEVGAIGLVGPSFPPASSDVRSASQLLGFVQRIDRFVYRIIRNPYRFFYRDYTILPILFFSYTIPYTILIRLNSITWRKDAQCLPRGMGETAYAKETHGKTIAVLQIANQIAANAWCKLHMVCMLPERCCFLCSQ